MTALWHIFRIIVRDQRVALLRGAALGIVVLLMGAALLGLSGWFITAAAAAGLAGLGTVFDVFRPSAMVRFLALGRTAARYGERLLTHDATLRALETLRLRLLHSYLTSPLQRMQMIRGPQALNRLMADIDALDGVPLRLVLPLCSALVVQLIAGIALWFLVTPTIALWITIGWTAGAGLVFWPSLVMATPLSRQREAAAQAFRSRLIDLIGSRRDLAVYGRLQHQVEAVTAAERRRLAIPLDRVDRATGFGLSLLGTLVGAGTLWLGLQAAQQGLVQPAFAALAFFAALALFETVAPLRRAASDLGRMAEAARRVRRDLARPDDRRVDQPATATNRETAPAKGRALSIRDLRLLRQGGAERLIQGLGLDVAAGEMVALTGASGCGKSTILLSIAGLNPVAEGEIRVLGRSLAAWPEAALREVLTLLPQRSAIMAGTLRETLQLADPGQTDDLLWSVLKCVQLQAFVRERGGLDMRLGHLGEGLSGGEARRLALARALLRRPHVLLLDEPTEGLDDETARAVLAGIRAFLPQAAILTASHRAVEKAAADRVIALDEVVSQM
jgi:ATP-binding cassette, subfamily C, bacterial CydC